MPTKRTYHPNSFNEPAAKAIRNSSQRPRILALLLDMDECLYPVLKTDNRDISQIIEQQFDKILEFMGNNLAHADEVELFLSSNRQTIHANELGNARFADEQSQAPTSFNVLYGLKVKLQDHLLMRGINPTIKVNEILMPDIYNHQNLGHFFQTFRDPQNLTDSEKSPYWLVDDYKISMVYAFLHSLAFKRPDARIDCYMFDDQDPILNSIARTFNNHGIGLPITQLTLCKLDQSLTLPAALDTISGHSQADAHYRINSVLLALYAWSYTEPRQIIKDTGQAFCSEVSLHDKDLSFLSGVDYHNPYQYFYQVQTRPTARQAILKTLEQALFDDHHITPQNCNNPIAKGIIQRSLHYMSKDSDSYNDTAKVKQVIKATQKLDSNPEQYEAQVFYSMLLQDLKLSFLSHHDTEHDIPFFLSKTVSQSLLPEVEGFMISIMSQYPNSQQHLNEANQPTYNTSKLT